VGGGLWDYVNVYTLPSHKLQFLAIAEARNVANAKKHWLSVWYFVSWNMSYFQLSDSVGLPLAMTHGSWQYNLMGHHHHLVVLTIKECTFYLLTSTTNLWAWHCCTVGLVYLCNATSTTNTRHNWIFYSLFRFFFFSASIISDTETVVSTSSEILVNTEDIVPETSASTSLLLDLFVLGLAKERDK